MTSLKRIFIKMAIFTVQQIWRAVTIANEDLYNAIAWSTFSLTEISL